jgi:predicted ester cyclase
MITDDNKVICSRLIDAINSGNMALFDEILAPNLVDHQIPENMPQTRDSSKQFVQMSRAAFPDLNYKLDLEVADGDRVLEYVTATGTMEGDFMGMKASCKKAVWTESHISRVVNGKIVEHWAEGDQVGMLQQLGFMPPSQS